MTSVLGRKRLFGAGRVREWGKLCTRGREALKKWEALELDRESFSDLKFPGSKHNIFFSLNS